MHFQNHRKSIIKNKKLTNPCPYHSRVTSTIDSHVKPRNMSESIPTPKQSRNLTRNEQQTKLPKILKKRKDLKTTKSTQSRITRKLSTYQSLIDPEYYSYGSRINMNIDYYQDMRLENEGWPSNAYFGKVYYARQNDAVTKAQNRVKQIYEDEYHNIRQELETINRIKERYKVLKNIEQDRAMLKYKLKKIKNKTTLTQTDAELSQNQQNNIKNK